MRRVQTSPKLNQEQVLATIVENKNDATLSEKSIFRKIGARTYKNLVTDIKFALEQVSLQDIRHWFTHSCYCTSLD